MKNKKLTALEQSVIKNSATEPPHTGEYTDCHHHGVYHCRACGESLYTSESKFNSHCGWPSFDDEIPHAVKRTRDPDGHRIEISCQRCGAHLGHVFEGENFTQKNTRHCVNSVSLIFHPKQENSLETIVLGGGCFWCLEAFFKRVKAVVSVTSGYAGGLEEDATYKQVCQGETKHAEVVRVVFDRTQLSYEQLLLMFFQAHDPTTLNRQGNDIGTQYRSVIFYENEQQKIQAQSVIKQINDEQVYNQPVVTTLESATDFYPAEVEHKNYFQRNFQQPYCQVVIAPKLRELLKKYTEQMHGD